MWKSSLPTAPAPRRAGESRRTPSKPCLCLLQRLCVDCGSRGATAVALSCPGDPSSPRSPLLFGEWEVLYASRPETAGGPFRSPLGRAVFPGQSARQTLAEPNLVLNEVGGWVPSAWWSRCLSEQCRRRLRAWRGGEGRMSFSMSCDELLGVGLLGGGAVEARARARCLCLLARVCPAGRSAARSGILADGPSLEGPVLQTAPALCLAGLLQSPPWLRPGCGAPASTSTRVHPGMSPTTPRPCSPGAGLLQSPGLPPGGCAPGGHL